MLTSSSVLFVPMPTDDELLVPAFDRGHPNAVNYRQRSIL